MTAAKPRPASSQPKEPWLSEAERIDRAVYAAVAGTATPRLDQAMRRLSRAADYSRLSISAGALLALGAGSRGRRAAVSGLASVAATATFVNVVVKPLGRRRRPDPAAEEVPAARQVRMPKSRSFPSGHTAAGVAFATGVARVIPAAGVPLHLLGAVVAYSRVHTGVHYPADVLAGALLGAMIGDVTAGALAAPPRPGASAGTTARISAGRSRRAGRLARWPLPAAGRCGARPPGRSRRCR
jgi:membrane-associated phospholipid phosphatase